MGFMFTVIAMTAFSVPNDTDPLVFVRVVWVRSCSGCQSSGPSLDIANAPPAGVTVGSVSTNSTWGRCNDNHNPPPDCVQGAQCTFNFLGFVGVADFLTG